jgi:hypothetical protein
MLKRLGLLPGGFSSLPDSNRFVAPPQLSLIFFLFNCGKNRQKTQTFLDPFRAPGQNGGLLESKPLQL